MSERPKTCATCAHNSGGLPYGKCMLSGYSMRVERQYPTLCGVDFKGWVQREPLLARFKFWLFKEAEK